MVLFLFFPWEFPADFSHAEVDLVHQGAEQHGVNFTAKRVKKATLGMRLEAWIPWTETPWLNTKKPLKLVCLGDSVAWKQWNMEDFFSPCFRDLTMVKIVLLCWFDYGT